MRKQRDLPIFCPTGVEKGLTTPKSDIFSGRVGGLVVNCRVFHRSHSLAYVCVKRTR